MEAQRVRPHFQTVVPEQTPGADGVFSHDLGVNPLSVLYVWLRPLNETSTLSNYNRYLTLVSAINRLRILYRGQSIVSMSGQDIAAMNMTRRNVEPRDPNPFNTDNARRAVCVPVFLGRFPGDAADCFPASRRGELVIELDLDIADTGYDGLKYSIESMELLNARPESYERCVTISQTFVAVGQADVALPIGWDVRGILLFGTTGVVGAVPAPTLGNLSVLLDNQQYWCASMEFETAMVQNSVLGGRNAVSDNHQHTSAAAASPTTNRFDIGTGGWENYAFMDFDISRNDAYSIPTKDANAFLLRVGVETANASRITPVERILVQG